MRVEMPPIREDIQNTQERIISAVQGILNQHPDKWSIEGRAGDQSLYVTLSTEINAPQIGGISVSQFQDPYTFFGKIEIVDPLKRVYALSTSQRRQPGYNGIIDLYNSSIRSGSKYDQELIEAIGKYFGIDLVNIPEVTISRCEYQSNSLHRLDAVRLLEQEEATFSLPDGYSGSTLADIRPQAA